MTDWSLATLTETAAAIADGRTTSRSVVERCLDRIRRFNPTIQSFVEVDEAGALAAADAADAHRRAGHPVGVLHGVPVAHKDMYHRRGRISSYGSRLRQDHAPTNTATVLERLDRAGAVDLGRLVMVEFAMGPHGFNANYPMCRNPWNTDYIPCGSSSGSGTAVAARFVHGSLGSDTGGSIRCPAAVAGLTGLVPTNGRVSRSGVMPMSFSLDVVGPLARTSRDCARMLQVIAGHDSRDATTLDVAVPDYEKAIDEPGPLPVIGIARGYFDEDMHPDVREALDDAIETLRRHGFEVRDVDMPADLISEVAELHPLVMKAEGVANHLDDMRAQPDAFTTEVGHRLHAGAFISAADYIRALKLRAFYLRSFCDRTFSVVDVLLTPLIGIPVPSIADTTGKTGKAYLDMVVSLTRNTKVVNYLGLPAMSVPCGFTSNGLPTSFQLIGRPLAEAVLLRTADRYQSETNWHRRAPNISSPVAATPPGVS